jgi:hypothetical protein
MVGFTSDEVQEAVNRFLFREVSVPRLKTGARDTLAIRDVIYDLVTTTLLLRTDSYFYLVYLAKNALRALVAQQIADLSQLDADAPNASRPAQLIDSTTDLTNAQAAILNVNAGLNSRRSGQGVRGSIGPAVDRFRRSVARFVSTELSKNVVSGTEIVETGEEVQAAIETTFAAITARHAELTQRAALLEQGTTNLASVSLPQSSVQGIVSRIQTRLAEVQDLLEGDSAIAESRGAFLELLTMRSLLTKASTFENPRQVLMPRVGDSSEVTLVDSGGVEARIAGTTSGPFNYAVGTQLDIVANGTPYTVDLPRGGSPEIRSVPLTGIFPWPPLGSYPLDLETDAGFKETSAIVPLNADGPALAASITTSMGLTPEVSCVWDAAENRLVFTRESLADNAFLRFLPADDDLPTPAALVLSTLFGQDEIKDGVFKPVLPPPAFSDPVRGGEVVEAVHQQVPNVTATAAIVAVADFTGAHTGVTPAVIQDRRVEGTDLTTVATSLTVAGENTNFEALGVEVGWGIVGTAGSIFTASITGVSGNQLTISAPPPSSVSAAGEYYIGPDYTGLGGERLVIGAGDDPGNPGRYRVVSGAIAEITVDRELAAADTSLAVTIFTERLALSSAGTTTGSSLQVTTDPVFGLSPTGVAVTAELTTFSVASGDPVARGVKAGDSVVLTSPAQTTYTRTIESVTNSRFSVTAGVPYEAGPWTYSITSVRADAYETFRSALGAYQSTTYAGEGFSALDPLVSRLARGGRYSSQISTAVNDYLTALTTLQSALDEYVVPRETAVDSVISTLREQGLDRAADMLLKLDVVGFFSMGRDEVSYGSNLTRKAATVAREVVPVSKYARSQQIVQEWRPVSFQPDPFDPLADDELGYEEDRSSSGQRL